MGRCLLDLVEGIGPRRGLYAAAPWPGIGVAQPPSVAGLRNSITMAAYGDLYISKNHKSASEAEIRNPLAARWN